VRTSETQKDEKEAKKENEGVKVCPKGGEIDGVNEGNVREEEGDREKL